MKGQPQKVCPVLKKQSAVIVLLKDVLEAGNNCERTFPFANKRITIHTLQEARNAPGSCRMEGAPSMLLGFPSLSSEMSAVYWTSQPSISIKFTGTLFVQRPTVCKTPVFPSCDYKHFQCFHLKMILRFIVNGSDVRTALTRTLLYFSRVWRRFVQNVGTCVCEVSTVGKISDSQPWGPGFNPGLVEG